MTRQHQIEYHWLNSSASDYPQQFHEISQAPDPLYYRGNKALLRWSPLVAVIGTRNPTPYGMKMTREIAHDLAQAQVCVVSGLALGIDAIAHEAALDAGGKTIAVLGTSITKLAPTRNRQLGERIIQQGLVISEYEPELRTQGWHFAARNRLISGLSRAVVITEAAERSGALITARWALDQGREVFVLPGPVDSEQSGGTLQLLRDGARLIRSAADILEDLGLSMARQLPFDGVNAYNHSGKQEPLMEYLSKEPIHMDELLEKSSLELSELSANLLRLELAGQIRLLPGQRYTRKH